jgi:hypothetical protein
MAKKRKSIAENGPSNDQHFPPPQPKFPDRDRLPSFSSTMPPRLKAPKLPDLPRAMAATQPEQAEKKSSEKKKNKKRRPVSADEAAHPQTGAEEDDEAENQAPPTITEKDAISDVSPERKRKNKKKRQSQVQSEVQPEVQSEVRFIKGVAYPGAVANPT